MNTKFIFLISALLSYQSHAVTAESSHDYIINSFDGKKVEYFWSEPESSGRFPLLLLIHPEQNSPKLGGRSFLDMGQFDYWTKKGFAVAAISQPGYGSSEGSPDFCGPKTQQSVLDLLAYFRTRSDINSKRVFVYGGSRGAVIASAIATRDPHLSGVILKSGVYDFPKWSSERPWYDMIKLTMFWEIGWLSEAKLKERSAIYNVKDIHAPILIIHGTKDTRAPISLAEEFSNAVNSVGGHAQIMKFESEHIIPMSEVDDLMYAFMQDK